jgi:hypothetical protein
LVVLGAGVVSAETQAAPPADMPSNSAAAKNNFFMVALPLVVVASWFVLTVGG